MSTTKRILFPLVLCSALLIASLRPVQDAEAEAPSFEGWTVVVTGANRGLGLEFARQLSADGAHVIGTARKPSQATELKALDVEVLALDVTDPLSVAALAANLKGRGVDLLINNAGVSGRKGQEDGVDYDVIAHVFNVNVLGPMRVTDALQDSLLEGEQRLVVNISSRLGSIELNDNGGYKGYRESKAALNMYSRSLAADMAKQGLRCIALSPGWVQTDMGGPQATLTPEESIGGMLKVIGGVTTETSGHYFSWDGSELPW